MFHRGWFRARVLCISLILSGPTAHAGDWATSLVKGVGNWAYKNANNIIMGTAAVASQYGSKNFNPDTGTFNFPDGMADVAGVKQVLSDRALTGAVMDNRGVPTGVQAPVTMPTSYAAEQRAADRMTDQQRTDWMVAHTTQKATGMSLKELNAQIIEHEQFLQGDKHDKARHKNRDKSYDTYAQQKAGELEALKKENASRQTKNTTFTHSMTDEELDKNIRNFTEKLEDAKAVYAEASKPEWWGKKNEARVEKGQVDTITNMLNRFTTEKENRTKGKVIHTVSTVMVLTSKTAGTDKTTTTPMEKAPEGGNGGGGAPDPRDPDKDPKKKIAQGMGMTAAGEAANEAAKSLGKKKEPHVEPHPEPHTSTTSTKHDKSMQDYKNHEQKLHDDAQKALKQARKAERAQMNHDPQPFHEKGIEPHFPQNPGQKIHQIEDRRGHFKEFTPGVEEAVRSTIKKEHFDYVENGNSRYTQEVKGIQVWVEVRPDGTIKNFGGNETFHIKDPVTGRYSRPPEAMNDKGVILGLGLAGALAGSETSATESKGGDFKLSPSTLKALGVDVQQKIKNDPNPLKLPEAPKDSVSSVMHSPEMKAIVQAKMDRLNSMTPQERLSEAMKPVTSPLPSITIPSAISGAKPITIGVPSSTPPPKMPTLSLPSSTSQSSGTRQTALPVLTSATSKPTSSPSASQIIAQHKASTSSRPVSIPSAPRSSTPSAPPRSSSSSSSGYRPSAPPSYGSRGGGPPSSFGGGYKRN